VKIQASRASLYSEWNGQTVATDTPKLRNHLPRQRSVATSESGFQVWPTPRARRRHPPWNHPPTILFKISKMAARPSRYLIQPISSSTDISHMQRHQRTHQSASFLVSQHRCEEEHSKSTTSKDHAKPTVNEECFIPQTLFTFSSVRAPRHTRQSRMVVIEKRCVAS